MITANRVLHCNADTPEEMHHWITLLQRSKGDTRVDGQEFIIRGDNAPSLKAPSLFFEGLESIPECTQAEKQIRFTAADTYKQYQRKSAVEAENIRKTKYISMLVL